MPAIVKHPTREICSSWGVDMMQSWRILLKTAQQTIPYQKMRGYTPLDKAFWQGIIDADYTMPPSHTLADLTRELLILLGSTDSQLRDVCGYPIPATWICRNLYTADELRDGDAVERKPEGRPW